MLIILIRLCIYYANRCFINLDNWNIFQQHNWHSYAWFFCFRDDNENEVVEAHIPRHWDSKTKKSRHRDSKTKNPRHRDSKTTKPRHRHSKTKKTRHQDSKTKKPRHRDSKTKKPRHRGSKTKRHDIETRVLKHHEKWRQISHDIVIPRRFFRGQKATTSRFQD